MYLLLIILFSFLSYYAGISSVLHEDYKPSLYSRAIWLLLAINSLVGLIRLNNDIGTVGLAGMQTLGSLLMFLVALKYSNRTFGIVEWIASGLLLISLIIWLVADAPFLNLSISLLAFFIGGIPTLVSVIKNPRSESIYFWLWFAIASSIAFWITNKGDAKEFIYALYFASFNILMTILSARRYINKNSFS